MAQISIYDYIGKGYEDIWFSNCSARYRACKGARNTKKSYNVVGAEPIFKILSDSRRNAMMIRNNYKDNGDSTYKMLKSTVMRLGLQKYFKCTVSPYQITYIPTGQVILFRGMNDVENITSTTVEVGYLTDVYFEEASQLRSYEDFRVVDGSVRAEDGIPLQITFCFNAWDIGHWLYDKFFKGNLEDNVLELEDKGYQFRYIPDFNIGYGYGLALHISSYKINEFRSSYYDEGMQQLKEKAYDIYLTEGLGCWGNTADKTYSHWNDTLIRPEQEINCREFDTLTIGIDTGLSNGEGKITYSENNAPRLGSAMTMCLFGVSNNWTKMVSVDEYYDTNIGRSSAEKKTEPQYVKELCSKLVEWCDTYHLWNTQIFAYIDSADVGFRDNMELQANTEEYGLYNITFIRSTKIPILTRVRFTNMMMAFGDFEVSTRCTNLIREIKNARKSKEGKCREDFDDHEINAMEYAFIPLRQRIARWGNFKDSN